MIRLDPFSEADFGRLISWVDNKELLITIAGLDFTFPLTADQLLTYLSQQDSHPFNIVDELTGKTIGHAEILVKQECLCKIDKLLIGDKAIRGRGIGQAVINSLLRYSFVNLKASLVELNVFDWNTAGIKCYTKCGFVKTPDSDRVFEFDGKHWTAFNMKIPRSRWQELRL